MVHRPFYTDTLEQPLIYHRFKKYVDKLYHTSGQMIATCSGRLVPPNSVDCKGIHPQKILLINEKNPGWLGCIGDYTAQFYRDFNKPL